MLSTVSLSRHCTLIKLFLKDNYLGLLIQFDNDLTRFNNAQISRAGRVNDYRPIADVLENITTTIVKSQHLATSLPKALTKLTEAVDIYVGIQELPDRSVRVDPDRIEKDLRQYYRGSPQMLAEIPAIMKLIVTEKRSDD